MLHARSPLGESSPADDAYLTLTSREFVALTGVTAERVRTWQRRFGFPASTPDRRGRRGFFASDVPRVLAVKQMVAGGEPVAEAVRGVLAGRTLHVDEQVLEEAFGALPTPVVALSGPAPVQLFWANAAALAATPNRDLPTFPYTLPDRSSALQHLLVEPPEAPVWVAHRPWLADDDTDDEAAGGLRTPVRSMAWAYGAPTFVPAILVVVDVPVTDAEQTAGADREVPSAAPSATERRAESRAEHEWAGAVGSARRALQRGTGRKALDDALGALVAAGVVCDATIVLPQGDELRPVLAARGRPALTAISPQACHELRTALDEDGPVTLGSVVAQEFAAGETGHAVAAPLVAGRVELGFLVLSGVQPPVESETHAALIMAFAVALAASIARDRALRNLQRVRAA